MPWTRSQSQLRDVALELPRRGASVTVSLCHHHSGVAQIVDKIVQHTTRANTPVQAFSIFTGDSHNTAWELANLTNTTGRNFSDVIRKALLALSECGAHGVSLFLKEAQLMRPRDLEKFLRATEHEASSNNIRLRIMLMQRPVERWAQPAKGVGCWREGWPQLPTFLKKRHQFRALEYIEVTREGLEELRGREIPRELYEEIVHPETRKALSA